MAVEGFEIIDSVVNKVLSMSVTQVFTNDITFTDGPVKVAREIQIQIYTETSSIVSIRLKNIVSGMTTDLGEYKINNGIAVEGAFTFTILVLSTYALNIVSSVQDITFNVIVAGG